MQGSNGVIFCNALPTTRHSFRLEVKDPKKDFISSYTKSRADHGKECSWEWYDKELVRPYMALKTGYSKFGFSFIDECTFETFTRIMNDPAFKIVILFSHCIENGTAAEQIEFHDTLILSEVICTKIPENLQRLYDFSVCKSEYLKQITQVTKGQNVYGTSSAFIPLAVWVAIYAETFGKMVLNNLNYIKAMDSVFMDARNRLAKKHIL